MLYLRYPTSKCSISRNPQAASLNTVSGVNMTPRRQLLKIKGLSEAKVEKIKVLSIGSGLVLSSLTHRNR